MLADDGSGVRGVSADDRLVAALAEEDPEVELDVRAVLEDANGLSLYRHDDIL
jgi:hypothetical protein